MEKYKINVTGVVENSETKFKCGFDITVENGGNVSEVGRALQTAINDMSSAEPFKEHPSTDN